MTLNAECVARPGKALKMRCPLSLRWRKQVPLRHNAALQQLLFERLVDSVPPWYSRLGVKPSYEALEAKAYRDVRYSLMMSSFREQGGRRIHPSQVEKGHYGRNDLSMDGQSEANI